MLICHFLTRISRDFKRRVIKRKGNRDFPFQLEYRREQKTLDFHAKYKKQTNKQNRQNEMLLFWGASEE